MASPLEDLIDEIHKAEMDEHGEESASNNSLTDAEEEDEEKLYKGTQSANYQRNNNNQGY